MILLFGRVLVGRFADAHAHKVGVLRASLSLRCCATLRTAHAPSACLTQTVF
ncbi:MAG: hypothetical protein NZ455_11870 [Bacteroidia bacterium]|nr:hypothetical protein [Bacteroidia bacterium]